MGGCSEEQPEGLSMQYPNPKRLLIQVKNLIDFRTFG